MNRSFFDCLKTYVVCQKVVATEYAVNAEKGTKEGRRRKERGGGFGGAKNRQSERILIDIRLQFSFNIFFEFITWNMHE